MENFNPSIPRYHLGLLQFDNQVESLLDAWIEKKHTIFQRFQVSNGGGCKMYGCDEGGGGDGDSGTFVASGLAWLWLWLWLCCGCSCGCGCGCGCCCCC